MRVAGADLTSTSSLLEDEQYNDVFRWNSLGFEFTPDEKRVCAAMGCNTMGAFHKQVIRTSSFRSFSITDHLFS
jgi:hypothetical protein